MNEKVWQLEDVYNDVEKLLTQAYFMIHVFLTAHPEFDELDMAMRSIDMAKDQVAQVMEDYIYAEEEDEEE